MKNKIVVTGSLGFIGNRIKKGLEKNHTVLGVDSNGTVDLENQLNINLLDFKMDYVLNQFKPNIIIHCASIKSLSICENEKLISFQNNIEATLKLVKYCIDKHIYFILISSDQVFSDCQGEKFKEHQLPNANNFYGKTKLVQETLVKLLTNFSICRTALVFDVLTESEIQYYKNDLFKPNIENQSLLPIWIGNKLYNKEKIQLEQNVFCSPTFAPILTNAIIRLCLEPKNGIFHISGEERISRYEFGCVISSLLHKEELIIPINNKNPLRPKDISLSRELSNKFIGSPKWNLYDSIKILVEQTPWSLINEK